MQYAVRITLAAMSPEPVYTGGPFTDGVAAMDSANPPASGWTAEYLVECGSFGERVDIATGGNYGQLTDTTVSLSNHDKWFAAFQTAGASLIGSLVEIGDASDFSNLIRWTGTVADADFQGANVEIRAESILVQREKTIPARVLTEAEFPGIITEGSVVPIVWGSVDATTPPTIRGTTDLPVTFISSSPGVTSAQWMTSAVIDSSSTSFMVTAIVAADPTEYLPLINSPWWERIVLGDTSIYVEIVSGTGSGQTRNVNATARSFRGPVDGMKSIRIRGFVDAWDTIPDKTSLVKIFVMDSAGSFVFADEGNAESLYYHSESADFPIPFTQGAITGAVTADVSGEFKSGNNLSAIKYIVPAENFGIAELTDLIAYMNSASSNDSVGVRVNSLSSLSAYIADGFCRTKILATQIPESLSGQSEINALFCFVLHGTATIANVRVIAVGRLFDGTEESILDGSTGLTAVDPSSQAFTNYPPSIAAGGEVGKYSTNELKISLPRPISAYSSIRIALFVDALGEYTQLNHDPYGAYSEGATKIQFAYNSYMASHVHVGGFIKPFYSTTSTEFNSRLLHSVSRNLYVGDYRDWREITHLAAIMSGGDQVGWEATFATPMNIPAGAYYVAVLYNGTPFASTFESEAGIGVTFGSVPIDSKLRADITSGRTYSSSWPALPSGKSIGDPITLARDAVLDMYYRDLGLPASAVDFASFQALPADAIHSALVEQVNSSQRVADLCQQFNWVVGHDAAGRETATAWLARVGTDEYDLSIDTGDVVQGSLTGVSVSDVLDLVNQPNIKWNWTQANGYRSESNVVDVKADPLSLNASNYLQYITGFGDFSTALETYTQMHGSRTLNNRQNAATFEFPDVGSDASAVLWPLVGVDRFSWMSTRKPLYQLSVPDTSAASSCNVGQRARLRHKRYTGGAWVYGTIVEWSYDPMAAECTITVMVDPTATTQNQIVLIDSIDPTGAIPLYVDQTDGTTGQYIDTIAGEV